jgi:hypothetical protein
MSEYTDGEVINVTFFDQPELDGEFVVKTGSVTDNGGDLIVFSDDDTRYAEFDKTDNRNWLQKWGGIWFIPNPFYQFHRNDITWFGADDE